MLSSSVLEVVCVWMLHLMRLSYFQSSQPSLQREKSKHEEMPVAILPITPISTVGGEESGSGENIGEEGNKL